MVGLANLQHLQIDTRDENGFKRAEAAVLCLGARGNDMGTLD